MYIISGELTYLVTKIDTPFARILTLTPSVVGSQESVQPEKVNYYP